MNPYEELGVTKDAAPDAIKRAYRRRAKKAHPDAGGSSEAMAKLNAAYEVLSDPARRAHYDRTGDTEQGGVDNTVAQLLSVLSAAVTTALQEMISSSIPAAQFDFLGAIDEALAKERNEIFPQLAKIDEVLGNLRGVDGRFSVEEGKPNYLEMITRGKVAELTSQRTPMADRLEKIAEALKYLSGVRYDGGRKRRNNQTVEEQMSVLMRGAFEEQMYNEVRVKKGKR